MFSSAELVGNLSVSQATCRQPENERLGRGKLECGLRYGDDHDRVVIRIQEDTSYTGKASEARGFSTSQVQLRTHSHLTYD